MKDLELSGSEKSKEHHEILPFIMSVTYSVIRDYTFVMIEHAVNADKRRNIPFRSPWTYLECVMRVIKHGSGQICSACRYGELSNDDENVPHIQRLERNIAVCIRSELCEMGINQTPCHHCIKSAMRCVIYDKDESVYERLRHECVRYCQSLMSRNNVNDHSINVSLLL